MRAPQLAFFLLVALALLAAIGAYGIVVHELKSPGPLAAERTVFIKPGSSTRAIADNLWQDGIINHPLVFVLGAKMQRAQGPLKAGEYMLKPPVSPQEIIALLQSGKTYQRQVTVAEGLMSIEIMTLIDSAEGLTGTVSTIPAEGSLLPETYNYSYGETKEALIGRMQSAMKKTLAELWPDRSADTPVSTPEETVTLAAIVEKETGVAAERPRVAGVFTNRLRKKMPLQSDPTVIYAITQGKYKFERGITRKDLNTSSPYNTYVTQGLPPGPIANPGRASLHAVLNPEKHDYFYFVADGTGGHAFGKTLDDHNRNVARWRQIEKSLKP